MKRTTTVISLSVMLFLSSALAVGNSIAFSYGGILDTYFSSSSVDYNSEEAQLALTQGKELAQEICQEGDVLLKNLNNALPLADDGSGTYRVNIFGWGGSDNGFMYQGGGSSEGGYSADKISLYQAFRLNDFEINENLARAYNSLSYRREGAPDQNQHSTYYRTYEPGEDFYDANLLDAVNFSDTAIVVLSRRATEGDDLPKVSYNESGVADDSRNYLALTVKEELMMEKVTANFDKVIVLINSSAPMEMGFLDDPNIDAALYVGYPGYYGAMAIPQILKGEVNPSGHMSDTCAYDLESAPSYVNSGPDASINYAGRGGRYKDYAEDIYVGYKWYETADEEGYFANEIRSAYGETKTGYDAVVQYPFGHGLSYTEFEWSLSKMTVSNEVEGITDQVITNGYTLKKDDVLKFEVLVENVGDVAGKDVVQLYYNPPYTREGIEKASQNLIGFEKTNLIEPNTDIGQILTFELKVQDMASYDTYDKNNNGFMGYELDQGTYNISFRVNAHETKEDSSAMVSGTTMSYTFNIPSGGYQYEYDSTTGNKVENRFTNYTNTTSGAVSKSQEKLSLYPISIDGHDDDPAYDQYINYLTRADFRGTFPTRSVTRSMSDTMFNNVFLVNHPSATDNPEDQMPRTGVTLSETITLDDVKGLDFDDPKWDDLISQLTIEEMQTLCANGGFGTSAINRINKGHCTDSDGGTGFTSGVATGDGGHATKYPAANILACTFDWKEAYKWGHAIGSEGQALNIQGWYAPGCNVHRSPLGGRNFEYFSEDGYMCGVFVAKTVEACTENGVYAYLKHFAANDTDEGRNGQFIWMTEQSFREIWAKPGEIATKVGKANAMMISVDRVGGVRATGSYATLTAMLRDEWGFRGSTITDYYQGGNVNDLDEGIRAGNDLALMPNGSRTLFDDWNNPSATSVIALQKAAKNILYTYIDTIYRTENFTGVDLNETMGQRQNDNSGVWWRYVLYSVDGVVGAGFISWAAICIYLTWFRKKKEENYEERES